MDYVSLHNHTNFSLLDAISSPKELFFRAKELEQKAIAVTDHGTFSGTWDCLKASRDSGVKLIQGCEFFFADNANNYSTKRIRHLILIAKNQVGYKNLLTLNRLGFDTKKTFGNRVMPIIDWELLSKYNEGVICLTACANGILGNLILNKKHEEVETQLKKLIDIFGSNLGLEIQPHAMKRSANNYLDIIDQATVNFKLISLGEKYNVKVVATTNSHYIKKEDHDTHDTFLAIGAGQPKYSNARIKYDQDELYVKSGEEVYNFFKRNFKEKAAAFVENSLYFSDLCQQADWIEPKYTNPSGRELPTFPVHHQPDYYQFKNWLTNRPEEFRNLEEDKTYMKYKCLETFDQKTPKDKREEYTARLEKELDVLYYCGVSSYNLIVADYVNWARNNGVSVGPGRGSVSGSLVAYLLNIHDADPIKYGLIFERFHNKLKVALSDIDVDFCQENRHKVIDYIVSKYGKDNVAGISNISTITPKVYARDISRACEIGGSRQEAVAIGDVIADSISKDSHSYSAAFKDSTLFAEYTKKYPEIEKFSKICSQFRGFSQHAAGIVISSRPLIGLVPLREDKDGGVIIEYDKVVAEDSGLVKMDILGLSTLDIIDKVYETIRKNGKNPIVPDLNEYDKKTYDLISAGDTFGVFQFGTSAGTIDLCKRIKPKSIEDLAVITTLARPASKEIREDFIKTRNGERKIKFLHSSLERALRPTHGFPLYDESLLILAKDVAGWDLNEADKLRKLTKEKGKNPKKAQGWRTDFINGAIQNNIKEADAIEIWEKIIEPFSRYSFNCAHAVSYSMISFHTAYLKANYPEEFLLTNLIYENQSKSQDSDDNVASFKLEIRKRGIKILPPNINKSDLTFKFIDSKTILTGLDALKSVGDDAVEEIVSKRPFSSFDDFMSRVDASKVRANAIQALAATGCFSDFPLNRRQVFLYCGDYRKKFQPFIKKNPLLKSEFKYPWPEEKEWDPSEIFALEKHYLGESFSFTKVKGFKTFFNDNISVSVAKAKSMQDRDVVRSMRGEIKDLFEFKVKKDTSKFFGKSMAKVTIEDAHGDQASLTIFPDRYEEIQKKFKKIFEIGCAIHFSANVNYYEEEFGLILNGIYACVPEPEKPKDFKEKKKVSMKKEKILVEDSDYDDIFNDVEEEMIQEGTITTLENE